MMKCAALLVGTALLAACASTPRAPSEVTTLVRELNAILPEGWHATLNKFATPDETGIHIEVAYAEPVLMYPHILAQPSNDDEGERQPAKEIFYFNFYLIPDTSQTTETHQYGKHTFYMFDERKLTPLVDESLSRECDKVLLTIEAILSRIQNGPFRARVPGKGQR